MPFGKYKDHADCVRQNSSKEDPDAYCAAIAKQAETSPKTTILNGKKYIIVAENAPLSITASIKKTTEEVKKDA